MNSSGLMKGWSNAKDVWWWWWWPLVAVLSISERFEKLSLSFRQKPSVIFEYWLQTKEKVLWHARKKSPKQSGWDKTKTKSSKKKKSKKTPRNKIKANNLKLMLCVHYCEVQAREEQRDIWVQRMKRAYVRRCLGVWTSASRLGAAAGLDSLIWPSMCNSVHPLLKTNSA